MRCSKVEKLLIAYSESRLPRAAVRDVRAHLERCVGCSRELAALSRMDAVLDEWGRVEPTQGFHALASRLERGCSQNRTIAVSGSIPVPRWAAGVLAIGSVAIGVVFGIPRSAVAPPDEPTAHQVVTALGFHGYDDVLEGSMVHEIAVGQSDNGGGVQ